MKRKFTVVPGKGITAASKTRNRRPIKAATYNGFDESKFDKNQLEEIQEGLKSGVDISVYADPKFDWYQMMEIRYGLESGVDVSQYADPKFGDGQMREILDGLEHGIDVSVYADPKFDKWQMAEIRKGLKSGVDINVYADPKFNWLQMERIREGLESGVDVSQYADPTISSDDTDYESSEWIDEDDFYDMDPEEFWEKYLSGAERELSDELKIYIEPSIQGGQGSIYIYDESEDDNESIGIDYQEWIEHEQAIAGESDSEEEFKNTMREYINGLIEDAGWDR